MATLTARDTEILVAAFDCFKAPVQVDYHKLAEEANFKNSASASVCYGGVKKKLLASKPLTTRDREILVHGWNCFKTVPQVDYKMLAEKAKFKNAASAGVCFGGVKKKLFGTSSTSEAKAPRGKKRKVSEAEGQEDEKKMKRAKEADTAEQAEDESDTINIKREPSPELF